MFFSFSILSSVYVIVMAGGSDRQQLVNQLHAIMAIQMFM
ncbi:hypothetical protein GLYMA_17G128350v4 [Glycine max]|nr:hypothetical protein GLYMA_17G128350v4 [Glycine max]KAH1118221.1 hypothetical protein GYH30_047119 [Glycine max]